MQPMHYIQYIGWIYPIRMEIYIDIVPEDFINFSKLSFLKNYQNISFLSYRRFTILQLDIFTVGIDLVIAIIFIVGAS